MGDLLQRAVLFAANAHSGQVRDGENPLPYICHPLEVLSNLRYIGVVTDEALLAAAALHDVIEECAVTCDQIETEFGTQVRKFVEALTRVEPTQAERAGLTKDEIWQMRSNLLLEEIRNMPPEVWPVKLSDRLSNFREARHAKPRKKLVRYAKQSVEILKIIPRKANPGLWDAIQDEIDAIGD